MLFEFQKQQQRNNMTPEQVFIKNLDFVSGSLAAWAQERFNDGWSIGDVKLHIEYAAKACKQMKE